MTRVFEWSGWLVLPFWALMIVVPGWRWTRRVASSPAIVLGAVLLYAVLVIPAIPALLPVLARPSLAEVAALLGTPLGATAAWAHFLAFDLFVGRYIYLDAQEHRVPAPLVSGLLLLTLLFGPLGLGGYWLLRAGSGPLRRLFTRSAEGNRALTTVAILGLFLTAAALALQLVDSRVVLGTSTWTKPAKFGVSVALTGLTLALLRHGLPTATRRFDQAGNAVAWLLGFELVLITVQAARGVPSHFNATSVLDMAIFSAMGVGITLAWLAMVLMGVQACRQRFEDRALGFGVRLGFALMLSGSILGFLMTRPTPAQSGVLASGQRPPAIGAHAVGVSDGGPGLPLTRWSTEGGDLRIPHFLGLHALQLLPLMAWGLGRKLRPTPALRLTVIAGAGYSAVSVLSLVQALRGQPLLTPDAVTAGVLVGIVVACAVASVVALVTSQPGGCPSPTRSYA